MLPGTVENLYNIHFPQSVTRGCQEQTGYFPWVVRQKELTWKPYEWTSLDG